MDLISIFSTALGLHSAFSALKTDENILSIKKTIGVISDNYSKLNENTFYVPGKNIIKPNSLTSQEIEVFSNQDVHIEQAQKYIGQPIISSDLITTRSLFNVNNINPNEFLIDIEPIKKETFSRLSSNSNMVGVVFLDKKGNPYIGWNKILLLNNYLGLDYDPDNWYEKPSRNKIFLPPEVKKNIKPKIVEPLEEEKIQAFDFYQKNNGLSEKNHEHLLSEISSISDLNSLVSFSRDNYEILKEIPNDSLLARTLVFKGYSFGLLTFERDEATGYISDMFKDIDSKYDYLLSVLVNYVSPFHYRTLLRPGLEKL